MPQTIWPSATVIMTNPRPVPRSASTANIAVTAQRHQQRAERDDEVAMAVVDQDRAGIGGDAEQPGMTQRDQSGIAHQHVQPERQDA